MTCAARVPSVGGRKEMERAKGRRENEDVGGRESWHKPRATEGRGDSLLARR